MSEITYSSLESKCRLQQDEIERLEADNKTLNEIVATLEEQLKFVAEEAANIEKPRTSGCRRRC